MISKRAALKRLTTWAFALSLLSEPVAMARTPGQSCYVLTQMTEYSGLNKTFVSSYGLKTSFRGLTVSILADKNLVYIINDKTRRYVECSAEYFLSKYSRPVAYIARRELTSGGTGKIAGLRASQYFSLSFRKDRRQKEFWTTTDLPVGKRMMNTLARVLDLPLDKGMPIRLVERYINQRREVVLLDTLSVKKVPYTVSILEPPRGFKKAPDEMSLIEGEQAPGSGADMLGDMLMEK